MKRANKLPLQLITNDKNNKRENPRQIYDRNFRR
jgi:hypothetical protein